MKVSALEVFQSFNKGDWKVFEFIASRADGLKFISTLHVDKIEDKIGMSRASYFRRLSKLVKMGFLRNPSRGIYELDKTKFDMTTKQQYLLNKTKA